MVRPGQLIRRQSARLSSAKRAAGIFSPGGIEHKVTIEPKMQNGKISSCNFKIQMAQKVDGVRVLVLSGRVK
jgi:hypothetical protein